MLRQWAKLRNGMEAHGRFFAFFLGLLVKTARSRCTSAQRMCALRRRRPAIESGAPGAEQE
eukprot:2773983-Prymnesium_polylepis.1